jgi:hypothetical protein
VRQHQGGGLRGRVDRFKDQKIKGIYPGQYERMRQDSQGRKTRTPGAGEKAED